MIDVKKIAFDIDGTLLDDQDKPIEYRIELLKDLARTGYEIIVWSGGGRDYAEEVVRRLKLQDFVSDAMSKLESDGSVDLAFDDQPNILLARVNIQLTWEDQSK